MNAVPLHFDDKRLSVDLSRFIDLAIPLHFDGEQPQFFGAPSASHRTLQSGDFLGDTRRGGSCNVDSLSLIPHCNGTHTECIGHVVDDVVSIAEVITGCFQQAMLISVEPGADNQGRPAMTAEAIKKALSQDRLERASSALILRTLPNSPDKTRHNYDAGEPPAYIAAAAMKVMVEYGITHLLVDIPSVDPMHDEGKLRAHRLFWGLPPDSHRLRDAKTERATCTITEMIFVPNRVSDGSYLLNLQMPAFYTDAAPSRPLIYPYDQIPR